MYLLRSMELKKRIKAALTLKRVKHKTVEPGLLHGNWHFARQLLFYLAILKFKR